MPIRPVARRKARWHIAGRSIRALLLALVAAVALPLATLSAYNLYADATLQLEREADAVQLQAQFTAASVTHLLGQTRGALEGLAARRGQLLDPAVCKAAAVSLMQFDALYANLVVRDHLDQPVCAALPGQGAPAKAVDPASFRRALDERQFVVGTPLLGPISKRWVVLARQPLLDDQGQAIGVINLPLDLLNLSAAIARLESPFAGVLILSLSQPDGMVLARAPDAEQWVGKNLREAGTVGQAIAAGQAQATGPGADGVERIYGLARVPATGWVVTAGVPSAAVTAPIRRAALQGGAVLLAVLALVALLAVAVARTVLRPIRALALTAHAVEGGRTDARVPTQGPAEVVAVAQQVNRMLNAQQVAMESLQEREQALRVSNERFESVFRAAPLPMTLARLRDDVLIDVNDAYCKYFGFSREELIGRVTLTLGTWVDLAQRESLKQRLIEHGRARDFPILRRLRSGAVREVLINADQIELDGETCALATLNDVTVRNLAEKSLLESTALRAAALHAQEADRLKTAFLSTMSHELRTPLNSIVGFTGILIQGLAGPLNAEQSKQLTMVQNSSRHLLALVNDVLDVARIEAGALRIHARRLDLRASIDKVVGSVTPQAQEKGLVLQVKLQPEVGEIVGDARRIEQVLLNLLGNAIKFTPSGAVGLSVSVDSDEVRMNVTDSGPGIAAQDAQTIFEPFQQLDNDLGHNQDGTGLGLTISARLARLMSGAITLENRVGGGSNFCFRFPRVAATEADGAISSEPGALA